MGLTFDGVNGISATGNIISSQGFISVTGNIYAGNIIATIASSVISINGNVTSGNVLSGGIISATGNIQGGNIRTNGIMSAASLSLDSPLLVANGGTGTTTIPANRVILGNGTGAVTTVAPSTNYNSLISNGTTWTSAPLIGSTWTSLGNRSQNVTYTNDTGKWIQVCGNFGCNGGGQGQIYIDGALISYWAAQFNGCGGFSVNMPCLVPPGSTYQLTAMGGAFRSWYELR
jgi:hypothetical protein